MFSCNLELVEVHKPREEVAVVQWCLDTMVRTRGGGWVSERSCTRIWSWERCPTVVVVVVRPHLVGEVVA